MSSRFVITRLESGRLRFVSHTPQMDTPWLAGKGVADGWQQRLPLIAYLSDDDRKTWRGGLLDDERHALSYPDAHQAEDGRIFLTDDFNRKTDREILMAAFTEEDVGARPFPSDRSRVRVLVNKTTGVAEAK